jgi:ABC-type nitrate/sulfonate/bicarbonate transport system permease component
MRVKTNKWQKFLAIVPIVGFLVAWEFSARFEIINPHLFPQPTKIVQTLAALFTEGLPSHSELLMHMLATLKRLLISFSVGVASGILVGILMGINKKCYLFLNPIISFFMPIPGMALAPLVIAWLGFGDPTIIFLGTISTFFPIVYNTIAGIKSVDKKLIRAGQIMGLSPLGIATQVYLPWSLVHVLNGVRIGLARGWMTIIAVEFIAASNWGIGYMIWNAAEYLRADVVYGGILVLIIIYYIIEQITVKNFENKTVTRWGMLSQKSSK